MFAMVAVLVFAASPAGAQVTYQWDADGGTGGIQDGAGAWQVGQPNWYDGTPNVNWADGTTHDAVFGGGTGGTAGTVTVSGTVAPASLTFDQPSAGNYTLTGGTIALDNGFFPADKIPILVTNNATGITTVSSTLNRSNDTTITTAAGTDLVLDGGGSGEFYVFKEGAGTLTLDGAHTWGHVDPGSNQSAWRVSGGTMNVVGNAVTAGRTNGGVENDSTMNITGSFTSGGHDQGIRGTVNLNGNGRWNLEGSGIFEIPVNGTLNINDNAVFDVDRNAGVGLTDAWTIGSICIGMGWGSSTGVINQNGGTSNLTFENESRTAGNAWGLAFGPGSWSGSDRVVQGTYNLNGGVLNVSAIGSFYDDGAGNLAKPETNNPGNAAIFNFNGGLAKCSQDDSTNADAIAEGSNYFIFNMTHVYIKEGGARIDTNTFNASINQELEHHPDLGGTADGGLQKLGAGTLTLLQESDYTGDTSVEAGVLEILHAFLDDDSSVSLLSGAMMGLNFAGADTIAGLTLGGAAKSAGTYDSTSDPLFFTGSGSLLVVGGAAAPGDTNGDGIVNDADLANFEAQFGGAPGAESADFDGDGDIDAHDFATMRGNWGFGTAPAPLSGAATPEPATMTLLAIGGLAVLRRRRKA